MAAHPSALWSQMKSYVRQYVSLSHASTGQPLEGNLQIKKQQVVVKVDQRKDRAGGKMNTNERESKLADLFNLR